MRWRWEHILNVKSSCQIGLEMYVPYAALDKIAGWLCWGLLLLSVIAMILLP